MKPSTRIRDLLILSLASSGWGFSFGLALPLGALWLTDAGLSNQLVGLSTSVYYLGVAGASLLLPWLMQRGSRVLVITGLFLGALTTVLFPYVNGLAGWFALRLLSGIATAICLIPMETSINHNAPPDRRARDFSIYAVSVALGIGLGDVVGLSLYQNSPPLAFLLGGLASLLAGILMLVGYQKELPVPQEDGLEPLQWKNHVFTLATAWFQGVLEGGVLTFMTTYLIGIGFGQATTSGLVGSLFFGVVLIQIPGAWVADAFGRFRVLLLCHIVVLASLLILPFIGEAWVMGLFLFAIGAASAFLYPLGMAVMGETVPPRQMGTANSYYLAINCLGSLMGPWVMGKAIDLWGPGAMFGTGILASGLVFFAWLVLQRSPQPILLALNSDSDQHAA